MTLAEYLKKEGLSDRQFGKKIKRAHTTVMRLKKGEHVPDPDTARKIFKATAGAVTPNDFFGIVGEAAE